MQENLKNIWRGFRFGMQAMILMAQICAGHHLAHPPTEPTPQIVVVQP